VDKTNNINLGTLELGKEKLSYTTFGDGPEVLFAFHGFDQNCMIYKELSRQISSNYTVFSFDLPFHGQSQWKNEELLLTEQFLSNAISEFLLERNIQAFSMIGFSIGCKLCLSLLNSFPSKIKKIIWIAPDGIAPNIWYQLATRTIAGRKLFKTFNSHPIWFLRILKWVYRLNLVDQSLYKFAHAQLGEPEKRKKIYNTWIVLRKLTFSKKGLAEKLNNHSIPLYLFTGKYDKIIKKEQLMSFLSLLDKYEHIELPTGHTYLIQEVGKHLKESKIILI